MPNHSLLEEIKSKKIKFNGVSSDSRSIKKGNIFFAIPGNEIDGSRFINQAIKKGAAAIVVPSYSKERYPKNTTVIKAKDIRKSLSLLAFEINKNNIETKIAITGTNGKTSVAYFLSYLLRISGKSVATIGTLGNSVLKRNKYNLTSPEPIDLSKQLKKIGQKKIKYLVMEASSHGLHQSRFYGMNFDVCALTNISHDHLDYHKTINNYIKSKMILFKDYIHKDSKLIINSKTKYIKKIRSILKKNKSVKPLYFQENRNYKIIKILKKNDIQHVKAIVGSKRILLKFKNFPNFQIENFIFAISILNLIGFDPRKLSKSSLNCPSVLGRMEYVGRTKTGGKVYVDFAHTPDALKNSIVESKKLETSNVHVLFGCGGNRDRKKRPLMGKIASKYADKATVTDDNPRYENPARIREEVIGNLKNISEIGNRKLAIKKAISELKRGDLLLIAGKGHEKFQSIMGKKLPFDDVKIAKKYLQKK